VSKYVAPKSMVFSVDQKSMVFSIDQKPMAFSDQIPHPTFQGVTVKSKTFTLLVLYVRIKTH